MLRQVPKRKGVALASAPLSHRSKELTPARGLVGLLRAGSHRSGHGELLVEVFLSLQNLMGAKPSGRL